MVEGPIPNENIKKEGYWAASGTDPASGQPIKTTEWIDRLAPKAWAVIAFGTCATYGGIHAMEGNPTGCMGLADYLGRDWLAGRAANRNVPGCPVQPDNFTETCFYLLYHVAGLAPIIPLDDQLRPTWLFGRTVHEGCDRAGYYKQGDFASDTVAKNASSNSDAGAQWSTAMFRNADGWRGLEAVRMSEESALAAQCPGSLTSSCHSWTSHPERRCRRQRPAHTASGSAPCAQ